MNRRALESAIHPPETYEVGDPVIVPVHTDDRWHNATVLEYPPWFNEKQRQKYVRVRIEDCGREENVLRQEIIRPSE